MAAFPPWPRIWLTAAFPRSWAGASRVYDPDATTAAATLYGALAQGLPLIRALADTYSEMLGRNALNPGDCQHWHLLRLYARRHQGHPPRSMPAASGMPSVEAPLVTAPNAPNRIRLTIPQHEPAYLDDEQRVPVADRASFVGRRRMLQRCLRALRRDATDLGVLLYGLGGHGKSTLAHRLRQRWLQNYRKAHPRGGLWQRWTRASCCTS